MMRMSGDSCSNHVGGSRPQGWVIELVGAQSRRCRGSLLISKKPLVYALIAQRARDNNIRLYYKPLSLIVQSGRISHTPNDPDENACIIHDNDSTHTLRQTQLSRVLARGLTRYVNLLFAIRPHPSDMEFRSVKDRQQ